MREKVSTFPSHEASDHERILQDASLRMMSMDLQNIPKDYVPEHGSQKWLPIDDVIKSVASRSKRPMFRSEVENSRYSLLIWRIFGPYNLARSHIQFAFSDIASRSPERREFDIGDCRRFLENCSELRESIAEFSRIEIEKIPHFSAIMNDLSKEDRAFRYSVTDDFIQLLKLLDSELRLFELWAGERYDEISPPQGGKPKSEWRHEFVSR
ncbi:hypothetical protein, partial [Roseibium sp.]